MNSDQKILAFIPAYNCAPQIGRVLAQFTGSVASYIDEILVLDNGSTDGTIEAAVAAAPNTTVAKVNIARNRANYNLGGSHKAAFAYAKAHGFSHVLVLHGDDQGSLADAEPIFASGLHTKIDACLGARFAKKSTLRGYSTFRIFGNRVFNALFSVGTMRNVLDLGSGLNIFSKRIFEDEKITRFSDDLRFNIYLLLYLFDSGRSVRYFPISWREDDQLSNVKLTSQAVRTLAILRDFVTRRAYFRQADFRDTKHDAYAFDMLFQKEPATTAGAI